MSKYLPDNSRIVAVEPSKGFSVVAHSKTASAVLSKAHKAGTESPSLMFVPQQGHMSFRVLFAKPAEKVFLGLDRDIQRRIARAIAALGTTPYPPDCAKLAGEADLYRVRAGEWRIVYTVQDRELIVLVLKIGHCGDVYRKR